MTEQFPTRGLRIPPEVLPPIGVGADRERRPPPEPPIPPVIAGLPAPSPGIPTPVPFPIIGTAANDPVFRRLSRRALLARIGLATVGGGLVGAAAFEIGSVALELLEKELEEKRRERAMVEAAADLATQSARARQSREFRTELDRPGPALSTEILVTSPPPPLVKPTAPVIPRPEVFPEVAPAPIPVPATVPAPSAPTIPGSIPTPRAPPAPFPALFPRLAATAFIGISPLTVGRPARLPFESPLPSPGRQPLTRLQRGVLRSIGPQFAPTPAPRQATARCQEVKRRRRRKGKCREGFFKEFPDRTRFTEWREVDCITREETAKSRTKRRAGELGADIINLGAERARRALGLDS